MARLGKPLTVDVFTDLIIAVDDLLDRQHTGNFDRVKFFAAMLGRLLATAPAEEHPQLCREVGELIVTSLNLMIETTEASTK